MEKSYYVISHNRGDIFEIEKELAAEGGGSFIPNRVCICVDEMLESPTASIWKLTKEEAEELKKHPKIKIVGEIEREEFEDDSEGIYRMPIKIAGASTPLPYNNQTEFEEENPTTVQEFLDRVENFQPAHFIMQSRDDWFEETNQTHDKTYEGKFKGVDGYTSIINYETDTTHYQADGEGVDIVVYDRSFGYHYDPEFDGKDGYRFKMVNWFKEAGYPEDHPRVVNWDNEVFYADGKNNHGKSVAVSAAGKYGGWAKSAHIYSIGVNDEVSPTVDGEQWHSARFLSLVLEWHLKKMSPEGNKRPTILVSSIASISRFPAGKMPSRGVYRGVPWEYNNETAEQLAYKYGLLTSTKFPYRVGGNVSADNEGRFAHTNYWMEECFKEGITVVRSSTNHGIYMDLPADTINPVKDYYPEGSVGLDYDNYVEYDNYTYNGVNNKYYYNRPTAPHFDGCIRVGALLLNYYINEEGSAQYRTPQGVLRQQNFIEAVSHTSGNGAAVSLYSHVGNQTTVHDGYFEYSEDNDVIPIGLKDPDDVSHWDWKRTPHPANRAFHTYYFSGTSCAAPNVAGIAACYLEKNPELTPTELHAKMLEESPREARQQEKKITDTNLSPTLRAITDDRRVYVSKVAYNPYWKRQAVDINGEINLHSSTYLENSDLTASNDFLIITEIAELLTQSTITVEKDQMTTENNQTTVTLQVKDNNNVNVTTDDLVVDFIPSQGTVGQVVSEGAGVYSATYFAPSAGTGSVEIKASIYGQEVLDTASLFFQGTLVQNPPSLVAQTLNQSSHATTLDTHYFSVLENTGAGRAFTRITATSDYTPLTFTKLPNASANVSLDQEGNSCEVILDPNPDYETLTAANCGVRCTDALGNFTDIDIVLQILDADDTPAVFTNGSTHTASSIDEGTMVGQVVYTAEAVDSVSDSAGSTITYSLPDPSALFIDSKNSNFFSIDSSTGELTLTTEINFETNPSLVCVILATDEAGNVSQQLVTFPINDVDEVRPTFISDPTPDTTLTVGLGEMTTVYTAEATDANSVYYSIEDVYEGSHFTINATTGVVTLVTAFNAVGFVKFRVKATDEAGNWRTRDVTLEVVEEVDAGAPTITSGITATAVLENSGSGQVVYTAEATDNSGFVYWTLADNSDDGLSIDGITGEVTLSHNPDYEVKTSYSFTIIATDPSGNSSSQIVTLPIGDVDESSPNFIYPVEDTLQYVSGVEVQNGITTDDVVYVGTVMAEDNFQSTDGVITYSIVDVDSQALFEINSSNGSLFIKEGVTISVSDAETRDLGEGTRYYLRCRVRASDATGNSKNTAFYVPLDDSTITSRFSNFGNLVQEVQPSNYDNTGDVQKVTHYINQSPDSAVWAIQGHGTIPAEDVNDYWTITDKNFDDGELRFEVVVHNDNRPTVFVYDDGMNYLQQSTYEFRVSYQEPNREGLAVLDVVLSLEPSDTYPPVLTVVQEPLSYTSEGSPDTRKMFEITSDEPVTWDIFTENNTSTDADGGLYEGNKAVQLEGFTLNGNDQYNPWIQFNPTGTNLEVHWFTSMSGGFTGAPADGISYTIRATDAAGNETLYPVTHNVAEAIQWTGEVTAPSFTGADIHPLLLSPMLNIYENTPAGTVITTASATRPDGTPLTDADNAVFTIGENSKIGINSDNQLYLKEDYYDLEESPNKYNTYIVTVTTPHDSSYVSLMVETLNVNEPPIWNDAIQNNHTFIIPQISAGAIAVNDISTLVSDPDDDEVFFTYTLNNGSGFWYLDDENNIRTTFDLSNSNSVLSTTMTVTATDGEGLSATRTFYFHPRPVYEDQKVFTGYQNSNAGDYGKRVGYVANLQKNLDNGYNPFGTVAPHGWSAVNYNMAILNFYVNYYMSSSVRWRNETPQGTYAQNTWNRIEITAGSGHELVLQKSDGSFSWNTGYTWWISSAFGYPVTDITYQNTSEQITVEWYL